MRREGSRQTIQDIHRRVFRSPLKTADVGTIHSRIESQPLLGEAALNPDASQIPGYQSAPVHNGKGAPWGLLNHWLYPFHYGELMVRCYRVGLRGFFADGS
jgi:hypothetical protein